jgi:hypothetical protein
VVTGGNVSQPGGMRNHKLDALSCLIKSIFSLMKASTREWRAQESLFGPDERY